MNYIDKVNIKGYEYEVHDTPIRNNVSELSSELNQLGEIIGVPEAIAGPASTIEIEDAAKLNAKNIIIDIQKQDLNGYDYPWPEGGGRNLLPLKAPGSYTVGGATISIYADGRVKVFRPLGSSGSKIEFNILNKTSLSFDTAVMFRVETSGTAGGCKLQLKKGSQWIDEGPVTENSSITSCAITCTSSTSMINITFKPMLFFPNTGEDATFSPYSNICPINKEITGTNISIYDNNNTLYNTISVSFPNGAIQGGTLDITNGKLIMNKGYYQITGEETIGYSSETDTYYIDNILNDILDAPYTEAFNGICDRFMAAPKTTGPSDWINTKQNWIGYYNKGIQFKIKNMPENNITRAKNCLIGTEILYPLAEPINTYDITPQQVSLLKGNNKITTGDGLITIEYWKNAEISIFNKINELESFIDALIYDRNKQAVDHGLFITNQPVDNLTTGTAEIKIVGPQDECIFTWKRLDGWTWADLDENYETTESLNDIINEVQWSKITTHRTTNTRYACFVSISNSTSEPVESRTVILKNQSE